MLHDIFCVQVFLLYTSLASKSTQNAGDNFRGLGYLDNHKDVLTLEFTVPAPRKKSEANVSSRKRKTRTGRSDEGGKTMDVQLAQDKTALRSRKGDTGSVLWRARYYGTSRLNSQMSLTCL